eukprot:72125-Rhodomonas_salina.3
MLTRGASAKGAEDHLAAREAEVVEEAEDKEDWGGGDAERRDYEEGCPGHHLRLPLQAPPQHPYRVHPHLLVVCHRRRQAASALEGGHLEAGRGGPLPRPVTVLRGRYLARTCPAPPLHLNPLLLRLVQHLLRALRPRQREIEDEEREPSEGGECSVEDAQEKNHRPHPRQKTPLRSAVPPAPPPSPLSAAGRGT